MRLRLLLRRFTVSAPRMTVSTSLPWPLRWALIAIMLGFCAAIGLWAFEFGRDLALDGSSRAELTRLRTDLEAAQQELATLKVERDKARAVANTADTLVTAEKTTRESLVAQNRLLEQENRSLRDDLGFFEKLIPTNQTDGMNVRALNAEMVGNKTLKWQVLVIQAGKKQTDFQGTLKVSFTGLQNGKSWSANLPGVPPSISIHQYGRVSGEFEVPPQVVVKSISVQVMAGDTVRASHTTKL